MTTINVRPKQATVYLFKCNDASFCVIDLMPQQKWTAVIKERTAEVARLNVRFEIGKAEFEDIFREEK